MHSMYDITVYYVSPLWPLSRPLCLFSPYLTDPGFPGSSAGEESACKAGDRGSIPGPERLPIPVFSNGRIHPQCGRRGFNPWIGKIPWSGERLPTALTLTPNPAVFWSGEFHGQRGLAGSSPCGQKESNTPEWLSLTSLTGPGAAFLVLPLDFNRIHFRTTVFSGVCFSGGWTC